MEKILKRFFTVLLLALLLSQELLSESYYITEEQMQTLERNYDELETLSKTQQEQLEKLNQELETVNQSLKESELRKFKEKIKVGAVTFSVGLGAGLLIAAIKNK